MTQLFVNNMFRMPEYFVVPKTMKDDDLKNAANQFIENRIPVSTQIGCD